MSNMFPMKSLSTGETLLRLFTLATMTTIILSCSAAGSSSSTSTSSTTSTSGGSDRAVAATTTVAPPVASAAATRSPPSSNGASKVTNSETCWGCWARGELLSSWPDCSCTCNLPTATPTNRSARFLRTDLATKLSAMDVEQEDSSKFVTLLYPTCRYLSSERIQFDAEFNVPTFEVTAVRFQRGIVRALDLIFEDQYHFHYLINSTITEGHSTLRFDIRDDGVTGNNFSVALLAARTSLKVYEHMLTGVPPASLGTGEPLISIVAADPGVAPINYNPVIGEVEGIPVYVETGYFFFAAILLACLMALIEASMTDNVAGDGMTMKEWMAPRGEGLPDGNGKTAAELEAAAVAGSPFSDRNKPGWGEGMAVDGPAVDEDDLDNAPRMSVDRNGRRKSSVGFTDDNRQPSGVHGGRRGSKQAWGTEEDDIDDGASNNYGRQGGEYSQAQYVDSEGESDDEDDDDEDKPQAGNQSRYKSAREDKAAAELEKKKSRVGSKYFLL